jgi:heterodisulfide reductase subunit A
VDEEKCNACGTCSEYCPVPVRDDYNEGLSTTKSVHMDYPQGIPAVYYVDEPSCLYLTKRECRQCEQVCQAKAIKFKQQAEQVELNVGAIVLAPGFSPVSQEVLSRYGYGIFPNVMTSLEFERILSASGPFGGHLVRPIDQNEPRKIAWLQCIGSRDVSCGEGYCSSVCCMYAIKEASIAKEHSKEPLDAAIFFMDIRTHGKDFERYYNRAKDVVGVRFVKSRITKIQQIEETGNLLLWYTDEVGKRVEEEFDMIVLSVGMATSPEVVELGQKLGISLTEGHFCHTDSFSPVTTSREGIYVSGAFQGPKDIPQSVIEASSAAALACAPLTPARNTLTKTIEIPEEKKVFGKRPRVGVFVCHCGINISSVVDIAEVCEYAKTLPFVQFVTDSLYSCAQDALDSLKEEIAEHRLNRVVVAACSPRTHEPLFQETLINARLNKYLFEMANIRNQDSWVHKDDPAMATEKAKDLVRMAVSKAALLQPLEESESDMNQRALVVGGGISGMMAAKSFSSHGYRVCLVEKSAHLGGQATKLYKTWKGEDVQRKLTELIKSVESESKIDVHLETELKAVEGFVGSFKTTLVSRGKEEAVDHGITVIATGAEEFKPNEYLYAEDPRVLTHLELDQRFINHDPSLKEIETAAFIQCVGSREPERPYCSRVCCTHSIERALHLKELNPNMNVYILYRDIRTYGEREYLYRAAREAGVVFVRYSLDQKPQVSAGQHGLEIQVFDVTIQRAILLKAELLTLASAVIQNRDEKLAGLFKIPMNEDGFFMEAHAKLRPSEFASEGVFLCGLAHYPKPIDESVAQAQAASSRAMTLLAKESILVGGTVAYVNSSFCSGCGVCVEICPYSAPSFIEDSSSPHRAEVNAVLCKGCGLCVASCRSGALNMKGYEERQIMTMINEI